MKTNKLIAAAIGLFLISASFVIKHYIKVPDFWTGLMFGLGIGLMFSAFIRRKAGPES